MKLDELETKILHGLVAFDSVFLHVLLDIDLYSCIDAVRTFRSLSDNFRDQITLWPERAERLKQEQSKVERSIVKSLIAQGQKHGLSENISKKMLANPDYPYQLTQSRDPVRNIGGH